MRFAAGIEYDGALFAGWQRQGHALTIQQVVEEALSRVADHPVAVHAAGRTDAGVHALQQVVHFDTTATRTPRGWMLGANSNLPRSVALHWVMPVGEDFHARFKAIRRRYRYVIDNRATRAPLHDRRATWEYRPLDVERMRAGAQFLIGTHDFSSYRAQECQAKSPTRTVHELTLRRDGSLIVLEIEADGFLHHMVRNIAGVLLDIGAGEREPDWAREVLELRNRTLGGVTAPPDGLYFLEPTYPPEFAIPRLTARGSLW